MTKIPSSKQLVQKAFEAGTTVPAFNIPYLPMIEPVAKAVRDCDAFAFIMVARLEWIKFESKSLLAIFNEYQNWKDSQHLRLHLDHLPVIDEDDLRVDFEPILLEALELGYDSVMIDASRLDLEENIIQTKIACDHAHRFEKACEAELGAVMGHEAGPMPPYEELFASGRGFTDPDEAMRFVKETGCDWLSVAIGNVHGAVSKATKDLKKISAKLDIDHLAKLRDKTNIPLVLHGGSGIECEYLIEAFAHGIAKINIATEIRQAYEQSIRENGDISKAQSAVYDRTCYLLDHHLKLAGNLHKIYSS